MHFDSKHPTVLSLDGVNLRLAGETFTDTQAAPAARPGALSRNTWVAGAIDGKLARENERAAFQARERRAHG